jgi:hypothetical protein
MLMHSICVLLLAVSAGSKGVQDSIAHHNSHKKRGFWWDNEVSWMLKYEHYYYTDASGKPTRPFVLHTLKHAFPGSKTWLVWTTDAWHFFGMLNMSAWQAAVCLLLPLAWYWQLAAFVAIKAYYGLLFEITYKNLNKNGQ